MLGLLGQVSEPGMNTLMSMHVPHAAGIMAGRMTVGMLCCMAGELRSAASGALCRRRLAQLESSGAASLGAYVAHCSAADATLVGEDAASGAVLGALALPAPLLVLTQRCLVVIADGGLGEAAVLQLAGAGPRPSILRPVKPGAILGK